MNYECANWLREFGGLRELAGHGCTRTLRISTDFYYKFFFVMRGLYFLQLWSVSPPQVLGRFEIQELVARG